jgi:hypothetical protein
VEQSRSWEAHKPSASQVFPQNAMETQSSLPISQQLGTSSYPKPNQSSTCLHPTSRKSISILSSLLRLGLTSSLFPSRFLTKTLYASVCHGKSYLLASLILLDFSNFRVRGSVRKQSNKASAIFRVIFVPKKSIPFNCSTILLLFHVVPDTVKQSVTPRN